MSGESMQATLQPGAVANRGITFAGAWASAVWRSLILRESYGARLARMLPQHRHIRAEGNSSA
jgi:hypothetical protein